MTNGLADLGIIDGDDGEWLDGSPFDSDWW